MKVILVISIVIDTEVTIEKKDQIEMTDINTIKNRNTMIYIKVRQNQDTNRRRVGTINKTMTEVHTNQKMKRIANQGSHQNRNNLQLMKKKKLRKK